MKIAISAYGRDLNAEINPRFGRCDYLLIVDTEDMRVECIPNENKDRSGGAGIQTASFVISKGVDYVLTGKCGPNATDVFSSSNVQVITGQAGTAGDAVQRLKEGGLAPQAPAAAPPVKDSSPGEPGAGGPGYAGSFNSPVPGMGGGCGRGMGRGRGQGRGMGGGCGMGRRR